MNSFAFGISDISHVDREKINFKQSDIAKLNNSFFDNTTMFYSCHVGTKDFNEGDKNMKRLLIGGKDK